MVSYSISPVLTTPGTVLTQDQQPQWSAWRTPRSPKCWSGEHRVWAGEGACTLVSDGPPVGESSKG